MEGILKRVCLFTLCAIIIRPPKVRVKSPIEIENLLDHTASYMEAEASPNRLPVKVIRKSGGYVRLNALVVTVNTTIFL